MEGTVYNFEECSARLMFLAKSFQLYSTAFRHKKGEYARKTSISIIFKIDN